MHQKKYANFILSVALLTVMSGCAELNSIHRSSTLDDGSRIDFIDAKQRAIISNKIVTDGIISGKDVLIRRFCSEPAPDVFSVYALSGGSDVRVEKEGTVGAALSIATSENASTIERTQLLNMLRESMFRTCERFINGAISKEEFSKQAARDQRVMLAALAIEQLTGIARSKPTVLTTTAASALAEDTKTRLERLDSARKATKDAKAAVTAAETEQKTKQDAYDALNKQGGTDVCDSLIADKKLKLEGPPSPPTKQECDTAKAELDKKNAAVSAAKTAATEAESYEKIVTKIVQMPSGSSSSVSGTLSSSGDGSEQVSETDRKAIAKAVETIVLSTTRDTSEITFTCNEIIRKNSNKTALSFCYEVLSQQFATDLQLVSSGRVNPDKTEQYLDALRKAIPPSTDGGNRTSPKPGPSSEEFWNECIHKNRDRVLEEDSPTVRERFVHQDTTEAGEIIVQIDEILLGALTSDPQSQEFESVSFLNGFCRGG